MRSYHQRDCWRNRAFNSSSVIGNCANARLQTNSRPTVKQRLAALRMLFDWMAVGQAMASNPAHAVRGPKHTPKKGKTPVLTPAEAGELLDAIEIESVVGLRDRTLIAMMIYSH